MSADGVPLACGWNAYIGPRPVCMDEYSHDDFSEKKASRARATAMEQASVSFASIERSRRGRKELTT